MPELRITVVMPKEVAPEEESGALDELMSGLASEAGRHAQFARAPGFGKNDGPLRVFNAIFAGPEALTAVLRGAGGWFMRYPYATITFRMESSKGGTTLQLKGYSPLTFAKAARQIEEYLE
jgi:hypothetical protein